MKYRDSCGEQQILKLLVPDGAARKTGQAWIASMQKVCVCWTTLNAFVVVCSLCVELYTKAYIYSMQKVFPGLL